MAKRRSQTKAVGEAGRWDAAWDAGIVRPPIRRGSEFMRWRGDDEPPAQAVLPDATLAKVRRPTKQQEWFLIKQDTTKVKG